MSENPQGVTPPPEPPTEQPEQPVPPQPPTQQPEQPEAPPQVADTADARTWAMLCHLGGIFGFLGPLILWLIKREEYPLVDDQGKEALNFEIGISIAVVGCLVLAVTFLVTVILRPLAYLMWLAMVGLLVVNIVMIILAALEANKGTRYRYPVCIRFIK